MRIIYRGNRVTTVCDRCQWTTTSTGPQAEDRVIKIAEEHKCSTVNIIPTVPDNLTEHAAEEAALAELDEKRYL